MGYGYLESQPHDEFIKDSFDMLALLGQGGFGTVHAVCAVQLQS